MSEQLIHIQDWVPTLLSAIGESSTDLGQIDGIDLWAMLSFGGKDSRRTELLHNIDDIYGNEAIRVGDWKLLHGRCPAAEHMNSWWETR